MFKPPALNIMKRLLLSLLIFFFVSLAYAGYEKGKTYDITFLHLNDTHGRFWKNSKGEGGFAAVHTLVERIRSEVMGKGGYVFFVHAGDINTGIPESDVQDAEPDIMGLNSIGLSVMSVGNHEFDNSPEVLQKQQLWAKFPFISANILAHGKPLFRESVTYSLDGLRLTFVGFTTEQTVTIGNPDFIKGLKFEPANKYAAKILPRLRNKSDVLVSLTHLGYYPGFSYGTEAPGDETLAKNYKNLDLIIGGHSHTKLDQVVIENGVPVAQAEAYGRYLGRVDLRFKDGKTEVIHSELIPVNLKKKATVDGKETEVYIDKEIIEHPATLAVLEPYQKKGEEGLSVVVGKIDDKFVGEREVVRSKETNLGNFVAYVQMVKTGADVGVMNSGGIRASMEAGNVTYKTLLSVQPFGNTLCVASLNDKELTEYLGVAASKTPGAGGFAQFYGVSFDYRNGKAENIKVNGEPLKSGKEYKIAVNSFIASGGDGYMNLKQHPSFVDTGYVDADVMLEFFKKNPDVRVSDFAPKGQVTRN